MTDNPPEVIAKSRPALHQLHGTNSTAVDIAAQSDENPPGSAAILLGNIGEIGNLEAAWSQEAIGEPGGGNRE